MQSWMALLLLLLQVQDAEAQSFFVRRGNCKTWPEEPACVGSPNYPSNYGSHEICSIDKNGTGLVSAVDFDTAAEDGILTIDGQTYDGHGLTKGPKNVNVSHSSVIFWHTSGGPCVQAYKYRWKICEVLSSTVTTTRLAFTVKEGPCKVVGASCVQTASYPENYGNGEFCRIIKNGAGFVTATDFDTERINDVLEVQGREYSGHSLSHGPKHAEVSNSSTIVWYSNRDGGFGRGWKICEDSTTTTTTLAAECVDAKERQVTAQTVVNKVCPSKHKWIMGQWGESCSHTCKAAGAKCIDGFWPTSYSQWSVIERAVGAPCSSRGSSCDSYTPYIETYGNNPSYYCHYACSSGYSTCTAADYAYRRICPCNGSSACDAASVILESAQKEVHLKCSSEHVKGISMASSLNVEGAEQSMTRLVEQICVFATVGLLLSVICLWKMSRRPGELAESLLGS